MPYALPYTLPTYLPGPLDALGDPPRIPGTLTPDEIDEVEDLILSQYLESPHLLALVRAYRNAIASRDSIVVAMYEQIHDIDRAEGVWLDRLGRLLGEPRDGRDDVDFRRGLRVRVLVNRSNGTAPELARIARLHEIAEGSDPDAQVRVSEPGPARVIVTIDATPTGPLRRAHGYLDEARAGGVALNTIGLVRPFDRAGAFRLVRPALAGTDGTYGLATLALDYGGALAHVLGS